MTTYKQRSVRNKEGNDGRYGIIDKYPPVRYSVVNNKKNADNKKPLIYLKFKFNNFKVYRKLGCTVII